MTVNLKAIAENLSALKEEANAKKFCAVVKADAYRHGAVRVAGEIENSADMFAVATSDEAVSLRFAGIKKDILILSPAAEGEIERLIPYGIIFTASSYSSLGALNAAADKADKVVRAHIKVNTGMNRYGFSVSEFSSGKLFSALKNAENVYAEGIYSHFYNPSDEAVRERQFSEFIFAASRAEKALERPLIKHVAATGGVAAGGGRYALDMIRCGLGLYGYSPVKGTVKLKPAMSVYAPVTERRGFVCGGAGYGGEYTGGKKEFSTVRFGYGDGLPFIDSLCMDAFVMPTDRIYKEKYVCVLKSAEDIALKYGTSVYKVLCSVSGRVEKRYIYV